MTAEPNYGPWIAHNATPDSTCPPDAVGKRGQIATETGVHDVSDFRNCIWCSHASGIIAYRILIEPVRGEVVSDGFVTSGGHWRPVDGLDRTHRLTIPTLDGALIPGEYIGPGGVITVTEVR